jgi:hypothetical protein
MNAPVAMFSTSQRDVKSFFERMSAVMLGSTCIDHCCRSSRITESQDGYAGRIGYRIISHTVSSKYQLATQRRRYNKFGKATHHVHVFHTISDGQQFCEALNTCPKHMCSIVAEATGRRQDAKEKSLRAGIVRLPDDVRTVSTYKAQNAHQLTYIEKQAATCSPKTHQSTNNKPIKGNQSK